MSPIPSAEAPYSATADCDARAESIRAPRPMREIPVTFAWLVLGCVAATAISLYFNIPPMWSPRSPRRVEHLYNAHPPLAYRLVRVGGPLHGAAAWCHLLAGLLSVAAIRAGGRPGSQTSTHGADRLQRGDRSRRFLFGLLAFHVIAWLGLVTEHPFLASALAAFAAVLCGCACVAGQGAPDGKLPKRFPMPHVPSLLLLGVVVTLGAPLVQCAVTPPATIVAPARQPLRDSAFAGDYARQCAQLLGASALLAGLIFGRWPPGQRRFAPFTLLLPAVVATVVSAGVSWYRQPLPRFGEAAPGVLYHSAQPSSWSLALAQRRYGFRTIVYLHPETSTAAHAEEVQFARRAGIRLIEAASSNLQPEDLLRLTRDPSARPILMHCIEGQNRTPAWLALYRISEQGWSLPEAYAEMERISGQRLKSYLVDWVEQGAARMKRAASAARTTPEPH